MPVQRVPVIPFIESGFILTLPTTVNSSDGSPAPYIRGNVVFGGIISLISRNIDLGYIDLPSSGLLVDYRMLDLSLADSLQTGVIDPRLPDVRNTI